MKFMENIFWALLRCLAICPNAGGPGYFDSVDGTYDDQTRLEFDPTLWFKARRRSIVGRLANAGRGQAAVSGMDAGLDMDLNGTPIIDRVKITQGDEVKRTLVEHAQGAPTYGDNAVRRGDFIAYQNMSARVNQIDSPAIPVQGRNARRRAAYSLKNIPGHVKQAVVNWMSEQQDFEFLYSLAAGGSPSIMNALADGGLAPTLGATGGTAGRQLMPYNTYVAGTGMVTKSATASTYNGSVNTALGNVGADATYIWTPKKASIIREALDDLYFPGCMFNGQQYKAVALVDGPMWYRINYAMRDWYLQAKPREGKNPIFDLQHVVEFEDIIYVNVPNLKKMRLAAGASYPSVGNGMTCDYRTFTPTSELSSIFYLGGRAVVEGYDAAITITEEKGEHNKGLEYSGHMDLGYMRSEFYAKDGRTDTGAVYNDSMLMAVFYEPGVGELWE